MCASRASAIAFTFALLMQLAPHPSTAEGFCIKFRPRDWRVEARLCGAAAHPEGKGYFHERRSHLT